MKRQHFTIISFSKLHNCEHNKIIHAEFKMDVNIVILCLLKFKIQHF